MVGVLALTTLTRTLHTQSGQYFSLEEALAHVDDARVLVLDKQPLETLPPAVATLHNLKSLVLHRNGLKRLPDGLTQLRTLTAIYIGGSPDLD